ncbi:small polypeptide DEVIL 11-like [Zingiber officinale]|uniref:small polypeptide DEVIL 11-like n=1 Tax=Zingiber officinale TaxID=94328 RepID=UPI001C4D7D1B|nr:small polypeptide DEVIL 11-like [Zingiber officinale]
MSPFDLHHFTASFEPILHFIILHRSPLFAFRWRRPVREKMEEVLTEEKWKASKKQGVLGRSASTRVRSTASRATPVTRSSSGRCARLVKEQRARFYIVRRCVSMLVRWRDCS